MLLDLNKNFNTLAREEAVQDLSMGKLLAESLAKTPGDLHPLKVMPWAYDLYDGLPIEIDKVDLDKLYKFVETMKTATPLAIAQILEEIKKVSNKEDV